MNGTFIFLLLISCLFNSIVSAKIIEDDPSLNNSENIELCQSVGCKEVVKGQGCPENFTKLEKVGNLGFFCCCPSSIKESK